MSRRGPRAAALIASAVAVVVAGCGGDDDSTTETTFRPNAEVAVAAPASLSAALSEISSSDEGKNSHIFFAGSDDHAQKIRGGDKPDLFLADDPALAEGLFDEGLVQEPVRFATDELVVAVPEKSKITSLEDLAKPGVRISIGHDGLPSGDYAREALAGLPEAERDRILANATVEQPNNNAIVIDLTEGDADAGFVYASDVVASNQTGGKLTAIDLPPDLRQQVVYAGAVVEGAANPPGAQDFLDNLLTEKSAGILERYGLGPAPG